MSYSTILTVLRLLICLPLRIKQHLRKYPHWDDVTTKELILEGWSHVSQKYINEKVATMPDRLRALISGEGKMTGY